MEKSETEKINTVKDTLDEVALVERHDNVWEDGILTIGTFGFHPLKPFNQQIEYLVLESEEDNNNEEMNSQGNSLHGTDDEYESGNNNIDDEEANPLISNYLPLTQILMASAADTDIAQDTTVKIDGKKKTQRTTLADLFLADSDFQMKLDSGKPMSGYIKKVKFERKNNLSFVKKLIPRLKNDSSPKKNMQTVSSSMYIFSLISLYKLSYSKYVKKSLSILTCNIM